MFKCKKKRLASSVLAGSRKTEAGLRLPQCKERGGGEDNGKRIILLQSINHPMVSLFSSTTYKWIIGVQDIMYV